MMLYRTGTKQDFVEGTSRAHLVVEAEISAEISWCAEHKDSDIRVRHYGELSCPRWHPDDECVIVTASVVVSPEALVGDTEQGLGHSQTPTNPPSPHGPPTDQSQEDTGRGGHD